MTDIELRQQGAIIPDQTATPGSDLVQWARQAEAAYMLAERICRTQMVPAAYKGKPDEACAAMLAGAELGFGPMASLRAFHPIQGTPAPAAITLRAVVTGHGHEIVVEESSNERAVVSGRRKGSDTWQTSVWDLARAQQLAQFKTNPNYKTNLAQMLVARATAEVCRWIASDAIMGMPYAAEEIEDQPALAPSPIGRRLTMADLDEPAAIEPAGEPMVTREQQKHLFALWTELGVGAKEQRHERLMKTAEILGLPDLETFNDLTAEQAGFAIAELQTLKAEAEAQGGES